MKSNLKKSVLGALAGISLILGAGAAGATDSTFCPTEFSGLNAAIYAGEFAAENDRTNLLGKSESAVLKSNILKVTDAQLILADIQVKAMALASAVKPKLDLTSANAIVGAAGAASTCVGAIAVQ